MLAPQEVKSFTRRSHLAGELIARIFLRWSEAWREALASALGAALSWFLAEHFLGHPQPIFAAISAIVCLSPGLPSHTRQTMGLLLGAATGIVIGELTLAFADTMPLLRIGLAAFFAMIAAASYGQLAVVPIQAGVSAILVVTFGSATTGSVRMADVAVGAAVGFLFSQVLSAADQKRQGRLIGIGCRRRGAARCSFSAIGTDCRKREPICRNPDALPRVGLPILVET
jgi:uncharacterized membrane protein YgaE (UPF0421/DUF939 family)